MAESCVDSHWFPDLTRLSRLVIVLGSAQLALLVVFLAPDSTAATPGRWLSTSGYVVWLTLAVVSVLCALRRILCRWTPGVSMVAAVMIAGAFVALGSSIVYLLFAAVGRPLLDGKVSLWRYSFGFASEAMVLIAVVLRYFYLSDRWRAQLAANARAQVDALQARIRPHFLFNSMNLIAGLLPADPIRAQQAVLDLSDLFRAALGVCEETSSLERECELAKRYLAIESLRLGERLQIQWNCQEPLPWSMPMPPLVLQPLFENAILHGISLLPAGGRIVIQLACTAEILHITITNPVPVAEASPLTIVQGAGHAQASIGHRLAFFFGPKDCMDTRLLDGHYICRLALPLNK